MLVVPSWMEATLPSPQVSGWQETEGLVHSMQWTGCVIMTCPASPGRNNKPLVKQLNSTDIRRRHRAQRGQGLPSRLRPVPDTQEDLAGPGESYGVLLLC